MSRKRFIKSESGFRCFQGELLLVFASVGIILAIAFSHLLMWLHPSGMELVALVIGLLVLGCLLVALCLSAGNIYENIHEMLFTPLYHAARKGKIDKVKKLLKNGANVNQRGSFFETALVKAAEQGHTEIVRVLLENGADMNPKDDAGWSALVEAARLGYTDIVKVLVDNGAHVNVKSISGETALMAAAGNGHINVVNVLAAKGAHINVKDEYSSMTALTRAAAGGHTDTVRALLDANADIDARIDGKTILQFAAQWNHTEILDLLKKAGAKE